MSSPPSPSRMAAARIPKITDLRDQLDYGNGRLTRCTSFIDDLRVFRRRYSLAGLRGTDLWDWKSPKHQDALKQMTATFLDEDGYGEVYWPSDPAAANFNSLQYSTDCTFITQTMRQLIFRLNLQQRRNEKYKKKPVHEIIELEDDEPDIVFNRQDSSLERQSISSATTATATIQTYATRAPPKVPDSLRQEHNVYDVPMSPEYAPEKPSKTKRKSRAMSNNDFQTRSKIVRLKVGGGKPFTPHLRPIAPMPKRTSPRRSRTLPRVNHANILDPGQLFTSPTSVTESTIVHENDHEAGHQKSTTVRQQTEIDEGDFNYIRTYQSSLRNESIPPTPIDVLRRATLDSNIDPNLERMSSPAFFVAPPTHEALHQPTPRLPQPYQTDAGSSHNIQPEAEKATPTTRTRFATEFTQGTNNTSASPCPLPAQNDVKETVERVAEPSTAGAKPKPAAASSIDSKPGIIFTYRVILSRTPIYQVKRWHPKGHFLEKSLSELIDELPFDNKEGVTGLIIQLTGPGATFEETIERNQDAEYKSTKGELMKIVKMCLNTHKKANSGSELVMEFKIEATRESGVEEDEEEGDDVLLF